MHHPNIHQRLDRLATYDNESIGQEFAPNVPSSGIERRRHQTRRNELMFQDWKEGFDKSESIPKSALSHVRRFETRRGYSESVITWIVTVILSAVAGTLCAIVIKHLNM
jgi:hypothetical protein